MSVDMVPYYFIDEAPTRDGFVITTATLPDKYEMMGDVPHFEDIGAMAEECVWCRIKYIDDSVDKADKLNSESEKCDDVHILQRAHAHIGNILTEDTNLGQALPLWRVIMLYSTAAPIRIDRWTLW
mmetsp:Transcript_28371/g.53566  ORF Transcript_28371/g.53566 Transcript_28371/m.53566 type:complete len:126 (-) Transcript_28371:5083-5460(-)